MASKPFAKLNAMYRVNQRYNYFNRNQSKPLIVNYGRRPWLPETVWKIFGRVKRLQ
jgi:hypothetical protein